jgi:hypothetical protein
LTYDHTYWTASAPAGADYVTSALQAGTAAFVIDRIGTGASVRPPADQVTLDAEATVTHQLVTALRTGELGHFTQIAGVGHSYGSIILQAETAAYHDLDRLVLTGLLHDMNMSTEAAFVTSLYPAAADPVFATAALPDGYLTTQPGSRAGFFLDARTALPTAAAYDEATKATATTGEIALDPSVEATYSRAVRVPVLLIVGSSDAIFCGPGLPCGTAAAICGREQPIYPNAPWLGAVTVPGTGHSLTRHTTAGVAASAANEWLTTPSPHVEHCVPAHTD